MLISLNDAHLIPWSDLLRIDGNDRCRLDAFSYVENLTVLITGGAMLLVNRGRKDFEGAKSHFNDTGNKTAIFPAYPLM